MFSLIMVTSVTVTFVLSIVGIEIARYINHLRMLDFAKKKKYFDLQTRVDSKWIEKYMLDELDSYELRTLIQNSINFNDNNTTIDNIPRNKMIKWTSYYLYFKSLWQLTDEELCRANNILTKIENKINIVFPNKNMIVDTHFYFLKFGSNTLCCNYRPSIVSIFLYFSKKMSYNDLSSNGFKMYEMKRSRIKYFYYTHNEHNAHNEHHIHNNIKPTIVFIHGLGIGITPYLDYIYSMMDDCNIIIPILPNISNMEIKSIFSDINEEYFFPSYKTLRKDFNSMLKYHNINKINIIAHSFGTIILGILMKDKELLSKIDKKVFIDPVCFIERSYKIFRYIDKQNNSQDNMINKVFNVLVYNDLFVRYITQRYLYGPEFWILDYNMLNNSIIVLSTEDELVPTSSIYKRCRKNNIPCLIINDARHADIFLSTDYKNVWNIILNFNRVGK